MVCHVFCRDLFFRRDCHVLSQPVLSWFVTFCHGVFCRGLSRFVTACFVAFCHGLFLN